MFTEAKDSLTHCATQVNCFHGDVSVNLCDIGCIFGADEWQTLLQQFVGVKGRKQTGFILLKNVKHSQQIDKIDSYKYALTSTLAT